MTREEYKKMFDAIIKDNLGAISDCMILDIKTDPEIVKVFTLMMVMFKSLDSVSPGIGVALAHQAREAFIYSYPDKQFFPDDNTVH